MTSTAGEPTGGPVPRTGQHAGPRVPDGYPGVFRSRPGGVPVLARIDLRGSALPGVRELAGLLPRAAPDIDSVLATVRPLGEDVRVRGARAVREITARLDGVDLEDFAVPQEAVDAALAGIDPAVRAALEEALARVRTVHADQRRTDVTTDVVPGGTVTERWLPVRRVGLYVPGGLAPLLSSVVMNVVPRSEEHTFELQSRQYLV